MILPLIEEEERNEIVSKLKAVSTFEQLIPNEMAEEKHKDPILELVCQYVTAGEKFKTALHENQIKSCREISFPVQQTCI